MIVQPGNAFGNSLTPASVALGFVEAQHLQAGQPLEMCQPHHQQQTFHVRHLRLAYPDAINIEAGAHSVWPASD